MLLMLFSFEGKNARLSLINEFFTWDTGRRNMFSEQLKLIHSSKSRGFESSKVDSQMLFSLVPVLCFSKKLYQKQSSKVLFFSYVKIEFRFM